MNTIRPHVPQRLRASKKGSTVSLDPEDTVGLARTLAAAGVQLYITRLGGIWHRPATPEQFAQVARDTPLRLAVREPGFGAYQRVPDQEDLEILHECHHGDTVPGGLEPHETNLRDAYALRRIARSGHTLLDRWDGIPVGPYAAYRIIHDRGFSAPGISVDDEGTADSHLASGGNAWNFFETRVSGPTSPSGSRYAAEFCQTIADYDKTRFPSERKNHTPSTVEIGAQRSSDPRSVFAGFAERWGVSAPTPREIGPNVYFAELDGNYTGRCLYVHTTPAEPGCLFHWEVDWTRPAPVMGP